MPECHTCPHREDVQSGKYSELPFDQTPCGSCELVEDSSRTMEFEQWRNEVSDGHQVVNGQHRPIHPVRSWKNDGPQEEHRPDLPIEVMRDLVTTLLTLAPEVRDVICWRYVGFKYSEIAVLQGTTIAAAEQRHRIAMRQTPVLRELFPLKVSKQKVRKPHMKGEAHEQGSDGRVEA